jgi:periplasmic copper chaperone A
LLIGTAVSLAASLAVAHVGVSSGPGFADKNQEIFFSVGHGCDDTMDTQTVTVTIPESVTSVRAVPSELGKPSVQRDPATELVRSVTWTRAVADLAPADDNYYKVALRIRVPNKPFTTLLFPTRQTCRTADGGTTFVDWVAEAENPDGGGPEPAPKLTILPARQPGWNKFPIPAAIPDLKVFFSDALIVWKGDAAFSANANTTQMIKDTPGVTELTSLAAGDEVWVKY